jgi:hypothetical protein
MHITQKPEEKRWRRLSPISMTSPKGVYRIRKIPSSDPIRKTLEEAGVGLRTHVGVRLNLRSTFQVVCIDIAVYVGNSPKPETPIAIMAGHPAFQFEGLFNELKEPAYASPGLFPANRMRYVRQALRPVFVLEDDEPEDSRDTHHNKIITDFSGMPQILRVIQRHIVPHVREINLPF